MANIRIKRTHRFGLDDARARVEVFAQSLREELQIDYAWDGNRLTFKRTSASGAIEIGADSIDLEVELGIAFWLLAGTIEKNINERLDNALK